MADLFELSAELTLDTAAFLRAIRQAEDAAHRLQAAVDRSLNAASAAMSRFQGSAASAMGGVAGSIQRAIDKARELSQVSLTPGRVTSGPAIRLATGMDYVPYDDFPAFLHEGEAVLTKLEAAAWRSAAPAPAPAPSADDLAQAMASALSGAAIVLDGQALGEWVAPAVNRHIARTARARRYA